MGCTPLYNVLNGIELRRHNVTLLSCGSAINFPVALQIISTWLRSCLRSVMWNDSQKVSWFLNCFFALFLIRSHCTDVYIYKKKSKKSKIAPMQIFIFVLF